MIQTRFRHMASLVLAASLSACNMQFPTIPTADSASAAEAVADASGQLDGVGAPPDSGPEAKGGTDTASGSDAAAPADVDATQQDIQVDPATAKADIGPAGGSLILPSGAQLVIPAGALAATVQIAIGAVVPPSAEQTKGAKPVGAALVLEPEGQQFLLPIEVKLPLDSKVAGNVDWGGAKLLIAPKGSAAFVTLDSTFSQDAKGAFVTAQITHFSWVVPALPPPGAVFITTKSLNAGTVGVGWGPLPLTATGGQPPFVWSVPAGGLPPGFELSSQGVLSGLPTVPGSFGFSVRCTDAAGTLVEKAFSLVVAAPKPTVTWLQPPQAPQGSPEMTVTVTGAQFVQGTIAYWKTLATPLPTTYVAADKLQVTLAASLLVSAGKSLVFVKNPDGAQANGYLFDVTYVAQNPVPKITKILPVSLSVGAADTQISVYGSGFIKTSLVTIGTQGLATQYVSAAELMAVVPASYLQAIGSLQVQVFNPEPGGGYSAIQSLVVQVGSGAETTADASDAAAGSSDVQDGGPTGEVVGSDIVSETASDADTADVPVVLKLGEVAPSYIQQWSGDTTLTIYGSALSADTQVLLSTTAGPVALPTVFNGEGLKATLAKAHFTTPGQLAITLKNPDGATAGPALIKVAANEKWGPPTDLSLAPSTTSQDAADQTLTIKGSFLPAGTTVSFGGTSLSVTWKSMWQLDCLLPATAHPAQGPVTVTITQPAESGGGSGTATFVVTAPGNPVPYLVPKAYGAGQILTSTVDQKLTFEGHNFVAATQIRWDGKPLVTSLGAGTVSATVPALLLAGPGVHTIDAFNPGPGGGASNTLTLTVIQAVPLPAVTALDPPEVRAGSSTAWVIVKGSGFLPWTTATLNGKAHPYVTYKSDKEIVLMILAADVKLAANLAIVLTNPDTPAKASAPIDFKVVNAGNAAPFINTLKPNSANKGTSNVSAVGTGGGMLAGARVWVDGVPRQTLTAAASSFTQYLNYADLGTAGTYQIAVQNPPPGGGFSIPQTFTVLGSNPAPIVTALSPTAVGAGTGNLTLKLTMSGWVSKTVVQFTVAGKTWPLGCTTGSTTFCEVTIPAAVLAVPGAASVKVVNPPAGGGASAAFTFTVEPGLPTPQVTGVAPGTLKLLASGQKLTITGSGFVPQTVVTETTTGTVLAAQAQTSEGGTLFFLDAAVPDALVAKVGTLQIQVSNPAVGSPAKGGGTTKLFAVQVKPQPEITSLSPLNTKAGTVVNGMKILGNYLNVSPSVQVQFTIEGIGEGNTFYASAKVISANELEVNVPVGATAKAGNVKVTVFAEGYMPSVATNWTVTP